MNIQEMKISAIKHNPSNPRIIKDHKFVKLVSSIKEFPQMLKLRPIVVDGNNMILGGNMRYKAAQEAGLKTIPVIVASELTPEQQAEFIVKDNVSYGEWDWELLANEWDTNLLQDWGFEPYHFGTSVSFLDNDTEEDDLDLVAEPPTGPEVIEKPKITDDGYVRYEIVIREEDKKYVVNTLNTVKKANDCTLGEAFLIIFKSYGNAE